MAEPHVIDASRGKRSELSGIVSHLEQQIVQHRASLVHLDAAMRLFDPDLVLEAIRSRQHRPRSVWFRPGECLRLIHAVLCSSHTSREWEQLTATFWALFPPPRLNDRIGAASNTDGASRGRTARQAPAATAIRQ